MVSAIKSKMIENTGVDNNSARIEFNYSTRIDERKKAYALVAA